MFGTATDSLLRIKRLPGIASGIASVYTANDNSSGSIWTTSHKWYRSKWNGLVGNGYVSVYIGIRTVLEPFHALV